MTLSGLAQRGFFIPYRYAAKVAGSGGRPPYRAIETLLRAREDAFRAFLSTIDGFAPELERIGTEAPPAPRWTQDWFPRLDAAAAYALVRSLKPRRIVEVGAPAIRPASSSAPSATVAWIQPSPPSTRCHAPTSRACR